MPDERIRVDALDFRILKELFAGETEAWRSDRIPLGTLARTLGVHRNTVSQHVRKLQRHRAFLPLTLEVEPGAFGLVGGLAFLDVPQAERTERTRDELFRLSGVQTILRLSDGWIVIVFARSAVELERTAERVRERARAATRIWEVHSVRDYPPVPRRSLSPLETRIVTALLEDSRVSFHRLGRRLGVAASTVERRFEALARAGLLYMYPGGDIDVRGMAMTYLHLRIEGDDEAAAYALPELLRVLPNHFIRNAATRGHAHFFLYGESLGELEGQLEYVRRIPFVRVESFRPFLGRWMNPGYRAWLARALAGEAMNAAIPTRETRIEGAGPAVSATAGARREAARASRPTSRRPSRRRSVGGPSARAPPAAGR